MSHPNPHPVVAVDAMGGDLGPSTIVPGVVDALRGDREFSAVLYGDRLAIEEQLAKHDAAGLPLTVVPCDQSIVMSEAPAAAIRNKPNSPIVRAVTDHKAGRVDAVVSAGSTGAMVAASLLILGRLPSVDRPAIGTLVPTVESDFLLLDAGANVHCTPEHLLCFGKMGSVYGQQLLGLSRPRVALLNIGEEDSKGSELTLAAHRLLRQSELNFLGNVESNRLLLGSADVVVTDGFTGNLTLKQFEGFGLFLAGLARNPSVPEQERRDLEPALRVLQKRFSYEAYGGALLLGIDGVSIISHGRSSRLAMTNAVLTAFRQVSLDFPNKLQAALSV